ncbi:tRNA pseudouridine32 synthase/23S rRNA pseudouridine746 synthase [Treponema rectale]|uniref:tRNA pseudouridine32 synthase/23S rRNA pseudouridine746 synthase n=1 Tax=Treponema rectale TaxID=744512 RepID=A0A840S9P8_9SPIR|nr:RluA family pseudouridine synthase [Treponema rectale]MBB5219419.1 tRNA pseudouridine32 synthase/23S rRNA pseudouridine746 synthase [Treponema rectale]
MFNPFREDEAYSECLKFINQIKTSEIKLVQISKESLERDNIGVMIGCLVCLDCDGKKIVLRTVSGNRYDVVSNVDDSSIFVKPIVSSIQIQEALEKNDLKIHQLTEKIESLDNSLEKSLFSKQRRLLTDESLNSVFNLYSFCCADGKVRSLKEICAITNGNNLPPAGTGDCCAPKLLNYAFSHEMNPISMCEVFYGNSKTRVSFEKSSPCDERCGLLLPVILGLDILYRDNDILVINKQSGLLSVPGRGPEKQDCVVNRMKRLYPFTMEQPAVHRLDMETSGLLVLAFNSDAHRKLSKQFEEGVVYKEYIALLDGVLSKFGIPEHGQKELYFRLDIENRPHQIWDEIYGKKAVTEWKILDVEYYTSPNGVRRPCTRILFLPHTGRTHQLRLISSDSHGFGVPIIGDTLYGTCNPGERLMLHASKLSFIHPATGERMCFECAPEF